MSKEVINMRKVAKVLKYLPKYELENICDATEMDPRQKKATIDYIYKGISVDQLAEDLCMSKGTFQTRKEILAMRVAFYMKDHHHPLADLL